MFGIGDIMQEMDSQLEDFLVTHGIVSHQDVATTKRHANEKQKSFRNALLDLGVVMPDELRRATAVLSGVPFVTFRKQDIENTALTLIPEALSRVRHVLALRTQGDTVEVALLDLADLAALSFLEAKWKVLPRLTDEASMKEGLLHYQQRLKQTLGDFIAKEVRSISPLNESDESISKDESALRVIDTLIEHALTSRATSIHLESLESTLLVRYRIDGRLYDAMQLPKSIAMSIMAHLRSLAGLPKRGSVTQAGRFRVKDALVTVSFVSTERGERTVIHLTPSRNIQEGFSLEALGFRGSSLESLYSVLTHAPGLLLVCGPEGSGKATTLYTLLDLLAQPDKNIIAVEESLKYRLKNAVQMQPTHDLSLSSAVRSALRQDPDVLMVGGVNDPATAALLISAANRGVLVLAGIIASDASSGIATLRKLAPSAPIASALKASVGVAHARKLCSTRESYAPTRSEFLFIDSIATPGRILSALKEDSVLEGRTQWKDVPFYRAQTCSLCDGGYIGRIGIQEVIVASGSIKDLIKEEDSADRIRKEASGEGMLTLIEDGICKVVGGYTTLEEIGRLVPAPL